MFQEKIIVTDIDISPVVLENNLLKLEFNNGTWTGLYFMDKPEIGNLVAMPADKPFEFMLRNQVLTSETINYGYPGIQSGAKTFSNAQWPTDNIIINYIGHEKLTDSSKRKVLNLNYICEKLLFTISYTIENGKAEIIREITLKNNHDVTGFLYQLILSMPFFNIGNADDNYFEIYDIRNSLHSLDCSLADFTPKQDDKCMKREKSFTAMDSDFHHEVSCLLYNPKTDLSMCIWGYSPDLEAVSYDYQTRSKALAFNQSWFPFCDLSKNKNIHCARQLINFANSDKNDAKQNLKRLKKVYGWTVPAVPDNLKQKLIYQVHGFIGDFGGFGGLNEWLEYLKDLGVGIIYLPPLAPPEAYLNYDPDMVMDVLGGKNEFKKFIAKAHSLGIKVIVDMIAHHLFRQSVSAQKRNFTRRDECGQPLSYSIGSVLTETRDPEYVQYYIECCRNLVEKYDIDGFRFDVAGFQLPNWDYDSINYERPGMGVLGQTELFQRMKNALDPLKKLIYLEEGMGINGFRYVSHGFIHLLRQLKEIANDGSPKLVELLAKMKHLLADREFKDRPEVVTMYHCKIHDTALLQQFGTFASGPERALIAFIMTIDGVPLITQGMERGYYDMVRGLARLKREYVEFSKGAMCFSRIKCSSSAVFAFTREYKEYKSLIAINFSRSTNSCKLTLDEFSQQIKLPPFGYKIFRISDKIEELVPLPLNLSIVKPSNADLKIDETDNYYCVKHGKNNFRFEKSTGHLINVNDVAVKTKLYLTNDFYQPLHYQNSATELNEGAFSGSYRQTGNIDQTTPPAGWETMNFDDSQWNSSFVPNTVLPYIQTISDFNGRYISDIVPRAINSLWTRHPQLRNGYSYFRKNFKCTGKVSHAEFNIISPSLYDFDLAVANGGITNNLMLQKNPIRIFLNGKELPPDILNKAPGKLFLNNNVIAVKSVKGCGSHGILGGLTLYLEDGGSRRIITDASWKCFSGNTITLKIKDSLIDENKIEFISTDNVKLIYCFTSEGTLDIAVSGPSQNKTKLFWELEIPGAEYWFAWDKKTYFVEKTFPWSKIKNAYSGSSWPSFHSNEVKIQPPFKFGLGFKKTEIVFGALDNNSMVEIYSTDNISRVILSAKLVIQRATRNKVIL